MASLENRAVAGLAIAAVLSHLPVISSWWCLDDWGQLSRAAGMLHQDGGFPARWISQHLWWSLTWPLFKLNASALTVIRLLIHGCATLLVYRIALAGRLTRVQAFVGTLLFAITPVAFIPLFWASGIQELLGALFALLALDRWLSTSRRDILLAGLFAVLSVFSKESGFGLPLFFAALNLFHWPPAPSCRRVRWAVIAVVLGFVVVEGGLVMSHFATGEGETYALGRGLTILTNLGKFGGWLVSFQPVFSGSITLPFLVLGWSLFAVWGLCAGLALRRQHSMAAAGLLWTVLALGPALLLVKQAHPYLAYLAAPGLYLTLGQALPAKLNPPRWSGPLLLLAGIGWGLWGTNFRIENTHVSGLPADPVVRASRVSRATARTLIAAKKAGITPAGIFIYQPPISASAVKEADRLGPDHVLPSPRYSAWEGDRGPRLLLGGDVTFGWRNSLLTVPPTAKILCETPSGFVDWGECRNALNYAVIVDVCLGHFDRARRYMLRANSLNPGLSGFQFQRELSPYSLEYFLSKAPGYIEWLDRLKDEGMVSEPGAGTLKEIFDLFLQSASGLPGN